MKLPSPLRTRVLPVFLAAVFSAACLGAPEARAQDFAVGAGGMIVNDIGHETALSSFARAGGYAFFEGVVDDSDVVLQARGSYFGLRGSKDENDVRGPELDVGALTLSVGYLVKQGWFTGGLYAGIGGYAVRPEDAVEGQPVLDRKQTVFGFNGAAVGIFRLARRWDARVELSGHFIKSQVDHKPVMLTGGVAYRF